MVVGSGLLAKAFTSYSNKDDVIIFASGVSNSKCDDAAQFQREQNLVKSFIQSSGLFVYFSTSSINDPFIKNSKYTEHKLEIEGIIRANFKNHLIVRLPNVVGHTENSNTLMNYIFNCVNGEVKIDIQENAKRYLIDVDDIFFYLDKVIQNETTLSKTVNLIVSEKISVHTIVRCFENHLGKTAKKMILSNQGGDYTLELDDIFVKYGIENLCNGETYLNEVLKKYYSKRMIT